MLDPLSVEHRLTAAEQDIAAAIQRLNDLAAKVDRITALAWVILASVGAVGLELLLLRR